MKKHITFFDLNNKNHKILYFKFKNKYEFKFTENERLSFFNDIINDLNSHESWRQSNTIIIPETSNQNLIALASQFSKKIIILSKNSKEKIIDFLHNQAMMKKEKEKILKIIHNFSEIKIANIPGNQRKRFIDCLFSDEINIEQQNKCVFFDDSIFSGYTYKAALSCLERKKVIHDDFILFNYQDVLSEKIITD